MKILVADDDAVSRRLMQGLLERGGYEVMTAVNGREAADKLATADCPRLALIDWMMPELDGPGLCREVRSRQDGSYIYITLLTSKQSREDIVIGLNAGADDYLTKPCNPDELKARLRTGVRILDLEDKLVEAREDMRFRATHDSLTSLWNRAAVLADLERELARSRREHGVISILICDLDHFKQVNDVHGHLIGDEVLKQAALRLSASVRPYDVVARYGGEEFLILLRDCDAAFSCKRAENLRESIAGFPFLTTKGPVSLTTSIGIITSSDWPDDLTGNQLLTEADHALYCAKAKGRNRVFTARPRA
jgi:two-component system cell cycle response regulator